MNGYEMFSNILFSKAGALGIPLSGTFELTSRCNLDCKMCYIHKRANDAHARSLEMSTRQWLDLAKECQQAGMLHLLLTGGEPTVRSDFKEIYTACRNLGIMVSINSNATLINDDMVAFLAANPPSRINITLYGASAETYERLCGDGSAYDRVIHAILALQKAGVLVKLNYSVTQYNRQDGDAIYAFAKEHGLVIQAATYMFPPVRACEQGCFLTDRMTPEEAAAEQIKYDRSRIPPEYLEQVWRDKLSGIRVPDPNDECQELPTERIKCRAGHSTFWVTWDGKMRPCGMMTVPSADIREMGFAAAWQEIRRAREEIFIPAKCTTCEISNACDACPALCYAETESFTEVPTYMCEKTKAYLKLIEQCVGKIQKNGEN